jgi:uncharacterized protein YecT (DUF1311 family)
MSYAHDEGIQSMMKKLIGVTLVSASMFAANAMAAEEDCKNPVSQIAMNVCAGKDYQREDATLNKLYKELVAKLEKDRRAKLKQVQVTWIKYRDLQCEFDSSNYDGGSMYPLVRSSCLARMTAQRNKELEAMLKEASL